MPKHANYQKRIYCKPLKRFTVSFDKYVMFISNQLTLQLCPGYFWRWGGVVLKQVPNPFLLVIKCLVLLDPH